MHSKTNILVLELPDRYDLNANSCVNREGEVFNRKLRKYMKAIECELTVEVNYSRNHYTRYEFHLNNRGKAHAARQLQATVNQIFTVSPCTSIPIDWLAVQRKQKSNSKSNCKECSNNHDSNDAVTSNKRLRKPSSKSEDFYGQ